MNHQRRTGRAGATKRFIENRIDFPLAASVLEKIDEMDPMFGKSRIAAAQLACQGQGIRGLAQGNLAQASRQKTQEAAAHTIDTAVPDFNHRLLAFLRGFEVEGKDAKTAPSHRPEPLPVGLMGGLAKQSLAFLE